MPIALSPGTPTTLQRPTPAIQPRPARPRDGEVILPALQGVIPIAARPPGRTRQRSDARRWAPPATPRRAIQTVPRPSPVGKGSPLSAARPDAEAAGNLTWSTPAAAA